MSANEQAKHDRLAQTPGTDEQPVAPTAEGAGAPAAGEPGTNELERLRTELEQARAEAAEHLDKFLRAKAEVDNTRRRAQIDVENAHKYAIDRFAKELLAVRDSLELARAVDIHQGNRVALEKMHEGLDLTLKLMDKAFEKFALVAIDPQGEKFDPERHQAMSMVDSDNVPGGHIVQVVQKGYLLHDRLLRPALVIVARPPGVQGAASGT
jgi:molecular chaperone GrpE